MKIICYCAGLTEQRLIELFQQGENPETIQQKKIACVQCRNCEQRIKAVWQKLQRTTK